MEEIFVNIVNYSQCNYLKVNVELNNKRLQIDFFDDGLKFNPLEKEEYVAPDEIDDAKIGGLGIHFVKNLADELYYEYKNNENHLTIVKSVVS